MDQQDIWKKAREYISKGDFQLSLQTVIQFVDTHDFDLEERKVNSFKKDLYHLNSRLITTEKFFQKGIRTNEAHQMELNLISLATLELIDEMDDMFQQSDKSDSALSNFPGVENPHPEPSLLIICSEEGLALAEFLRKRLLPYTAPHIYEQNEFLFNSIQFQSLLHELEMASFCIFVLTVEDLYRFQISADNKHRDHINFIMGLALGCLDRDHLAYIKPRFLRNSHLAIDLVDLQWGTYHLQFSTGFTITESFLTKMIRKLEALTPEDQKLISVKNRKIEEIEVKYSLSILNEQGDCFIQKSPTIQINEGISSHREHEIYSDSNSMSWEDLHLEAWEESGSRLSFRKIRDLPNRKRFAILFQPPLSAGQPFTYHYKCKWEGMFPKGSNSFTVKNTVPLLHFELNLPLDWKLQNVNAKAIEEGQLHFMPILKRVKTKSSSKWTTYLFELYSEVLHVETEVSWDWARKG